MAVTKKVLNALDGCDEPFKADSDIIQASKQKLTDREVKTSNGTGIKILSDSYLAESGLSASGTSEVCANVASFAINT